MEEVVKYLIAHGLTITTMESCTGGLLASTITDTEGSSAVFKGGFVTYSNEAKVRAGVPADVIETYGVYSPQTAEAMARACRCVYGADIGVGVTGTLGNFDPNNADSIPGEVYYAISYGDSGGSSKDDGNSLSNGKDSLKTCHMTFDTTRLTRHAMKENIVKNIASTLQTLL